MSRLESGKYYHIYNRGVNSGNIIYDSDNDILFFLKQYKFYLGLSCQTLAYVVMHNHYHFLVKILDDTAIEQRIVKLTKSGSDNYYVHPNEKKKRFSTSLLWSHLFNSYTRYINTKYHRTGPLWDAPFNRILIAKRSQLLYTICYIHRNPLHHGISQSYREYPFSSYQDILFNNSSLVDTHEVIRVFGSTQNFLAAHEETKMI